jgi:hypothetical protein
VGNATKRIEHTKKGIHYTKKEQNTQKKILKQNIKKNFLKRVVCFLFSEEVVCFLKFKTKRGSH